MSAGTGARRVPEGEALVAPPCLDVGPMEPPITVVGDIHLSEDDPATEARFLAFLDRLPPGGHLVLLGDLFDWWVGRRQQQMPLARRVLEGLRRVGERGTALAFVAGNRDYAFDGADGLDVAIWPDVVRARWGARTVVLSHGDLLCTADHGYLAMRRWLRAPPARWLLRTLPLAVSAWLARGLRDVSDRSVRRKPGPMLGIDYGAARRWLEAYDADVLVLGHVHTGVHHRLPDGGGEVLVLKDWHARGGVIVADGETIALETVARA